MKRLKLRRGDLIAYASIESQNIRTWSSERNIRGLNAKPRVFVNTDAIDELIRPKGYHSIPKQAADLMLRAQLMIIQPSIEQALAEKYGVEDVKVRFSAKAGCRCGCSPGFIVETFIPALTRTDTRMKIVPATATEATPEG